LTDEPSTTPGRKHKHRVLRTVAISVSLVLVVVIAGGFLVYRHLNKNITSIPLGTALGTDRPKEMPKKPSAPSKPLNILLIGSDTRKGAGNHVGGQTPGLSDTTILLHLAASRKLAYGVSLPRDAMVQRPACQRKDGNGVDPGGLTQFNDAFAIGGPLCTVKTVEHLTDVRIDHFVVIDFNGFKKVVDALGGVQVCVPHEVNDTTGHIHLPAGTYNVEGQRALDYVRVRHDLGVPNGDIGRMKRQQAFLASMTNKAISAGTLANPVRLYRFLDAATKSISTDPGLASLSKLAGLAKSLKGIGLNHIQFLTVPFQEYAPNPNRLQWAPEAKKLWSRIREDKPVGKKFGEVTTAAHKAGKHGKTSKKKSASSSPTPSRTAAAQNAEENGLCA
jgi:LCP family protein required for cell wall assembly